MKDPKDILPTPLQIKAMNYGVDCHANVNHRYGNGPYATHLNMVWTYAKMFEYLLPEDEREDFAAAAWTHDVIEDCRQTYNDVKKATNERIADITFALTNEKGKTRKDRANDKYYAEMKEIPAAVLLKLCDRMANISYSKGEGSRMFDMYKKENEVFIQKLWKPQFRFDDAFDELTKLVE